jgi:predicted secreted Zn-dependent protease
LIKTPYILAHEQAHFDITEIFARKLHKALMEYDFDQSTYKRDINSIYQRVVAEKEAFQAAYDKETDHSRNKRIQYEWLDQIDAILVDTEPYADYP